MGLLDKFFNGGGDRNRRMRGDPFEDSASEEDLNLEAARLDRLRLVLRDTMRRHAVPSDWIECRCMPAILPRGGMGLQAVLVVSPGQARELMLTYIPAFQASLQAELTRVDPKHAQWLLGIAWQFDGISARDATSLLPKPGSERPSGPAPLAPASTPAPLDFPGHGPAAAAAASADDDAAIREDLEALFAIRDAALRSGPAADFEPTRPGGASDPGGETGRR